MIHLIIDCDRQFITSQSEKTRFVQVANSIDPFTVTAFLISTRLDQVYEPRLHYNFDITFNCLVTSFLWESVSIYTQNNRKEV